MTDPMTCTHCGSIETPRFAICIQCKRTYCWRCTNGYYWYELYPPYAEGHIDHTDLSNSVPYLHCLSCVRAIEQLYVVHAPFEELPVLLGIYENTRIDPFHKRGLLLQIVKDRLQGVFPRIT